SVSLAVRDGATDEALRGHDPTLELGMPQIDPRVDHGHSDRGELRKVGPVVEGAVLRQVPLARGQRVVRHEDGRCARRAGQEQGDQRRECQPGAGHDVTFTRSAFVRTLPTTSRYWVGSVGVTWIEKVPSGEGLTADPS